MDVFKSGIHLCLVKFIPYHCLTLLQSINFSLKEGKVTILGVLPKRAC